MMESIYHVACRMLGRSFTDARGLLEQSLFYYCSGRDPTPVVAFGAEYPLYVYVDSLVYQRKGLDGTVREQMAEYRVVMHESYEYEYDEDDYPTRGSDTKIFEVADMVSLKSGCYSTNEVWGDIVLRGGTFAGVILYMYKKGGNGWDNYDYWWYTVMFTDGSRTKDNVSYYSFSGSSSSKYYEYTYTLEKKGEWLSAWRKVIQNAKARRILAARFRVWGSV